MRLRKKMTVMKKQRSVYHQENGVGKRVTQKMIRLNQVVVQVDKNEVEAVAGVDAENKVEAVDEVEAVAGAEAVDKVEAVAGAEAVDKVEGVAGAEAVDKVEGVDRVEKEEGRIKEGEAEDLEEKIKAKRTRKKGRG